MIKVSITLRTQLIRKTWSILKWICSESVNAILTNFHTLIQPSGPNLQANNPWCSQKALLGLQLGKESFDQKAKMMTHLNSNGALTMHLHMVVKTLDVTVVVAHQVQEEPSLFVGA